MTRTAPDDDQPEAEVGTGSDSTLGHLEALVDPKHWTTIEVLVWVFRTGRQIEAWLADTLAAEGLDTSEFAALNALWMSGAPHRLSAGEIADSLVQTSGGTTKTIRRLEDRGLVRRIADPSDGRRSLVELSATGLETARNALDHVLDAFDLDIGDLDAAERSELGERLARISGELGDRLRRR
ncbi:MAG: MarR family transcriptional regulator [Acidimicrobiales bacterium]